MHIIKICAYISTKLSTPIYLQTSLRLSMYKTLCVYICTKFSALYIYKLSALIYVQNSIRPYSQVQNFLRLHMYKLFAPICTKLGTYICTKLYAPIYPHSHLPSKYIPTPSPICVKTFSGIYNKTIVLHQNIYGFL